MYKVKLSIFVFFLLCNFWTGAQNSDSIKYSIGFHFKEGLYLTKEDFKANNPIPFSSIISTKDTANFLKKLCEQKKVAYIDKGDTITGKLGTFWGASDGARVYYFSSNMIRVSVFGKEMNEKPKPVELNVIGSVCVFKINKIISFNNNANSIDQSTSSNSLYTTNTSTSTETYLMDIQSGNFAILKSRSVDSLLQKDTTLYKEFKNYQGPKKEKAMVFIIKYNQRHPLYIKKEDL